MHYLQAVLISNCTSKKKKYILWLLIWLVNYVAMLFVCQLSRDVIGYENS